MFHIFDTLDTLICFTICLFISPDLDGYRAPKRINPTRPTRSRNPNTKPLCCEPPRMCAVSSVVKSRLTTSKKSSCAFSSHRRILRNHACERAPSIGCQLLSALSASSDTPPRSWIEPAPLEHRPGARQSTAPHPTRIREEGHSFLVPHRALQSLKHLISAASKKKTEGRNSFLH